MDVIRAIEDYQYYHDMTGQGREEWAAWRVQACGEWMLDKKILGKESGKDGSGESEHESTGNRGQGRGEREHRLPDAARVPGEDGQVREGVRRPGDIPGGCHRL